MKIEAKAKDAEMIAMKAKNAIMEAKQEAQHILEKYQFPL